jgi:hypothetical protein
MAPPRDVCLTYLADSLLPFFNAWRAKHGIEPHPPRSGPPITLEQFKAAAAEYRAREALREEQDRAQEAEWKAIYRRPEKLSPASIAKQANELGLTVTSYEVKPDGSVVIVTGDPQPTDATDERHTAPTNGVRARTEITVPKPGRDISTPAFQTESHMTDSQTHLDRPPSWSKLELEAVKPLSKVEELTSLDRDTLVRVYPEYLVKLSPKRWGMKFRNVLRIMNGDAAA